MANRFWVGGTATWDGTAGTKWATTSGGGGGAAVPTASDDVFFDGASGAVTVTVGNSRVCRNLNCTGFTGTLTGAPSPGLIFSGDLTWGAGMNLNITAAMGGNSTAAQNITSNGKQLLAGLSLTSSGSYTLQDALSITGALTLTLAGGGAFHSNGKDITAGSIASSNTNVRNCDFGGTAQVILLCGVAAPWAFATVTNLTFTAPNRLIFQNNTAVTYQFQTGGLTYNDVEIGGNGSGAGSTQQANSTIRDWFFTNTGGMVFTNSTGPVAVRHFDCTGFTGTYAGTSPLPLSGNLTINSTMTWSNTAQIQLTATSGTQSVTCNGGTLGGDLVPSGTGGGGTVQLADALKMTATKGLQLKLGTFDCNGKAVDWSGLNLAPAGFGVRGFIGGSSVLTCRGSVTPFSCASLTNLTFNGGTAEFIFNDTGPGTKTIGLFGLTVHKITISGAGTGSFLIQGNIAQVTTIDVLSVLNPPHTVIFQDHVTLIAILYNIGSIAAVGSAGNLISFVSANAGAKYQLQKSSGDITGCDYLSISDCIATGGARWFAGRHSVDAGGNNGWRFTDKYLAPIARA